MGAVHHTIAPSMYPKLDYDIEKIFVPLALMANGPQVLVVNPRNLPFADFRAYLEAVRKAPGKHNYGSAGAGTSHHLAGELFKQQTKTFITHIPYRGAGPALEDLIFGQRRHDARRPGFLGYSHQGRTHQGTDGVRHQAQPGLPGRALRR